MASGRNTSSTPKLNLLDLPVDILSIILQPLLTSPAPIPLCPCSRSPINPLPVLLSHPALHAIAVPLLYTANEFVLDATGPHAKHLQRQLAAVAEASQEVHRGGNDGMPSAIPAALLTTQDARRRVANLQVRLSRLRGWVHEELVPILTEMVVQGSLEHLIVWIQTPGGERQPQQRRVQERAEIEDGDLAIFRRPPLESLLCVLADPYLQTSRLWVDGRRHLRAWCRFHSAGGPGTECGTLGRAGAGFGTGGGTGGAQDGRIEGVDGVEGGAESDAVVVEVDWCEILRVVDPERRDVAVVGDGTRRRYY